MVRLTREQSQIQTKERLKRAASDLIARNGSAGTGIEQIAREAGYSRGAFYSNYRDKLALLLDILEDRQTRELQFWKFVFSSTVDNDDCLMSVVTSAQALGRPWIRINLELHLEAERNEQFRPYFRAHLATIYAAMRDLFAVILMQHGKSVPKNLDDSVIGARALGLNVGLPSFFGFDESWKDASHRLIHAYILNIIVSAPAANAADDAAMRVQSGATPPIMNITAPTALGGSS